MLKTFFQEAQSTEYLVEYIIAAIGFFISAIGWLVNYINSRDLMLEKSMLDEKLMEKQIELEREKKLQYSWKMKYVDQIIEWVSEIEDLIFKKVKLDNSFEHFSQANHGNIDLMKSRIANIKDSIGDTTPDPYEFNKKEKFEEIEKLEKLIDQQQNAYVEELTKHSEVDIDGQIITLSARIGYYKHLARIIGGEELSQSLREYARSIINLANFSLDKLHWTEDQLTSEAVQDWITTTENLFDAFGNSI